MVVLRMRLTITTWSTRPTDHAQLETFLIRGVIQYGTGSAFVVYPYQNGNRISGV